MAMANRSPIMESYIQKNQTFREGLEVLQQSIDEPAAREAHLQSLEQIEQAANFKLSETDPEYIEQKQREYDPAHGVLNACLSRYKAKSKVDKKTHKLM